MRRMLPTAIAAAALAAPSAALAHGDRHHSRHHRAHHARVLIFRARRAATPVTPATPATPATPSGSEETVGTVASFANETLTITLNDGTTVSGKVTERTEIECEAPPATASAADFNQGDGQGPESGHDGSFSSGAEGEGSREDSGDGGEGSHEGSSCPDHSEGSDGESSHCTTAALVPGAKVKEAELALTGTGAVWEKVEL